MLKKITAFGFIHTRREDNSMFPSPVEKMRIERRSIKSFLFIFFIVFSSKAVKGFD